MKITNEQADAAAIYWTLIITGELKPNALIASQKKFSFMRQLTEGNRQIYVQELKEKADGLLSNFKDNLSSLIKMENNSLEIELNYAYQGVLNLAVEMTKIDKKFLPDGQLNMRFDDKGNILVEEEIINATEFLRENSGKIVASNP